MNNQFNLNRFSLLFKKHTVEHYRGYLMSLFVLLGLLVTIICSITELGTMPLKIDTQMAVYCSLLILAGTIFTSNVFLNLGDKKKAVTTLLLPASAFEKFLVGWIYSFLVFQLTFTAMFYAVIWLFLHIKGSTDIMDLFSTRLRVYLVVVFYCFLHAIAIYGAIYFKKMHFIKTAFAFFIMVMVIWLLNNMILKNILPVHQFSSNLPFMGVSFVSGNSYYMLGSTNDFRSWSCIMFVALSFIIWAATYFRLKEKQI